MTDSLLSLLVRWFRNQDTVYTQGFTNVLFLQFAGFSLHGPTNLVLDADSRQDYIGDTFSCQVRRVNFEPDNANTLITGEYVMKPIIYVGGVRQDWETLSILSTRCLYNRECLLGISEGNGCLCLSTPSAEGG